MAERTLCARNAWSRFEAQHTAATAAAAAAPTSALLTVVSTRALERSWGYTKFSALLRVCD